MVERDFWGNYNMRKDVGMIFEFDILVKDGDRLSFRKIR